jgi:hypothetical protein
MIGGGICNQVVEYIEQWVPEAHDDEYGFQNELQSYLDTQLNESGNPDVHVGLGGGTGEQYQVKREYGKSNADVAVGDEVGIEMKYDLTNGQINELRGQIEAYKKEFPCVIAVACGITDIDGWRGLQNDYGGVGTVGMQMNESEVHFVHKREEHFGKDPSAVQDDSDGFMNGGGLF